MGTVRRGLSRAAAVRFASRPHRRPPQDGQEGGAEQGGDGSGEGADGLGRPASLDSFLERLQYDEFGDLESTAAFAMADAEAAAAHEHAHGGEGPALHWTQRALIVHEHGGEGLWPCT